MSEIIWLEPNQVAFPPVDHALEDPNGLLAAGGALTTSWLLHAYRHGIFPWFEAGQPILWWSPDPRLVLKPCDVHVSKSMRKFLRTSRYQFTFDKAFNQVIDACSQPRETSAGTLTGTWITDEMKAAYIGLHEEGYAHSAEVWDGDALLGGLYGVALNGIFFGESMFSRASNASKMAFILLCKHLNAWRYSLIDCQVETDHLQSLGAYNITRDRFCELLAQHADKHANDARFLPKRWKAMDDLINIYEL